jgi:glycosyltransferase involved in cell wall biosynthesis
MRPETPQNISGLRVLWVSHGYGYDGDFMYFGEIFKYFRKLVPDMGVVVEAGAHYQNQYGIRLLPLMHMLRKKLRRTAPDGQTYDTEVKLPSPTMLRALSRQKADVLITIEFTPAALFATLASSISRRTRLVLLIESDPAARGGSRNPLVRSIKRLAVRRADVIQTNNAKGRRYLEEDLGADPGKVIVAPYLTSRPPGPPASIEAGTGPLKILFANSLTPRKGLRQLIAALAVIDPEVRSQIALTVVGDGPERSELEPLAAELNLGDRLRFVGRRNYAELGAFYADAEVLAIPSLADYRSLAGFEGLGYGLVLLASRHDGASEETVEDGVNGHVIEPEDAPGLARRISELVADRNRVLDMRRASLALYENRFSLEKIASNIARSVAIASGGETHSAGAGGTEDRPRPFEELPDTTERRDRADAM